MMDGVSVYITQESRTAARALAKVEGDTMTAVIGRAIEQYVKQHPEQERLLRAIELRRQLDEMEEA